MGRITRKKAAEVAETLHIDPDAVLQLNEEGSPAKVGATSIEQDDRLPLGELHSNSADNKSQSDDGSQDLKRSTRSRGGKKAATAKKNRAASTASEAERPEISKASPEVLPDENDSTPSPASEKAAEELLKDIPEWAVDITRTPVDDTKEPQKAVKLTRSQIAKTVAFEAEPKSLVDGIGQTPEEHKIMKEELTAAKANNITPDITRSEVADTTRSETVMPTALKAPISPLPGAVPTILAHLRADTPAKRSTSNKENIEPQDTTSRQASIDEAPVDRAMTAPTPPEPSRQSSPRLADSITALDELDEAVENVNKDIPDVRTSPEKPKDTKGGLVRRESKKAAPVVRGTKASQARISLAQSSDVTSKAPALGRSRPSTTIGRSSSVRESTTARSQAASKRVPFGSSVRASRPPEDGEKKGVVIPHSKPRPISLSFPAPPPAAKSTKAPTQSSFQLPGEAVAAKLRAAREARAQKESDEDQKKTFKARPVPSSLSRAPSVRQTTASKARESIMAGKDMTALGSSMNTASKRLSSMHTTTAKPRTIANPTSKPTPATTKPSPPCLTVRKRPSSTLPNNSHPRTSLATNTSTATRISSNGAKGTQKGREVFNRPAAAKAAAEKEKSEKEAAAKKARAEAAERGRLASREWAERQKNGKKKGAEGKDVKEMEVSATEVTPAVVEAPIASPTVEVV